MLVVIDNYDSFTFNLVQYLGELGAEMRVFRNDRTSLAELEGLAPTHLLISPGPKRPEDAGLSCAAITAFAGQIPVLGVCLGHQSIGHVFGATVDRAAEPMHGKTSDVYHDGRGVFAGLPSPFAATRYHSLVILPETMPECLERSAWTGDGTIMGVRHREYTVEGVQFHPESILTSEGKALLSNFLRTSGGRW